jgi:hypothetical protein
LREVTAVNSDEVRALEQLKEANDIITSSLQNDLDILRGRYKNLEVDHEQARTHLIEALLAKDSTSKELAAFAEGKQTSNDPEADKKAKKALQALKEVSCETAGRETGLSPKSHKFLNLGRPDIFFYPRSPTKPAKVIRADVLRGSNLRNTTQDGDIRLLAGRESILERVTIRSGIFPTFPLLVKPKPSKQVFRATTTLDDAANNVPMANNPRSRPKTKKVLSRTFKHGSK